MIQKRPAGDRGTTRIGWLDSRHTFSFGSYYDPANTGFSDLLVINDDRVEPGQGFGTHGHRDMEILSYVLHGGLEHRDSLGSGSVLRPGTLQRMSAGTGVRHSEVNSSRTDPLRFLQIWIVPEREGIAPGYEEKTLSWVPGRPLVLAASRDGHDGSATIHQDAALSIGRLAAAEDVSYTLLPGRRAWIQVATGHVSVNGVELEEGDGAAVSSEKELRIHAAAPSEVLLFDLR